MIIIKELSQLEKCEKDIKNLINKKIENYQFYYENLYALHKSNSEIITFIDNKKQCFTSFKPKDEDIMECCINIEPIYIGNSYKEKVECFIQEIYNYFDNKTLYFPLVYENSEFYKVISQNNKFYKYKRLYTSIVEPSKIKNLFEYLDDNKYFSKSAVKKFEKKLKVKYYIKQNVEKILANIEKESWKSCVGQDMYTHYDKIIYYNELIKKGVAQIAVAIDEENKPVAYRIDAILNDMAIQLKTSFSEKYKKYSPGAYLTIYDMFNNLKNFRQIDLYGGPNLLKDLVETKRINRYDICFGNTKVIEELKESRLNWDERNFKEKRAIKRIYDKKGDFQ